MIRYWEYTVALANSFGAIDVPVPRHYRAVMLDISAKATGNETRYFMGAQLAGANGVVDTTATYNWEYIRGYNLGGNGDATSAQGGNGSEVRLPLGIIPGSLSGLDVHHFGHTIAWFHRVNDPSPVKKGVTGLYSMSSSNSVNGIESGTFGGRWERSDPIHVIRVMLDDQQYFVPMTQVVAYGLE